MATLEKEMKLETLVGLKETELRPYEAPLLVAPPKTAPPPKREALASVARSA